MPYIANTDADRAAMLATIGVANVEALFADVPAQGRYPDFALPPALSEMEILRELEALAGCNDPVNSHSSFLGAGAYRHFIPSVVRAVLQRSEFSTSYTPYQPEVSQGTLQAHFEYQSMLAGLTGMETANVSHYDGATSTAEAVIMALNIASAENTRVVVSPTLPPQYRAVLRTYLQGHPAEIVGENAPPGDLDALATLIADGAACLVVANPDFLGRVYAPEALKALAEQIHARGGLFIIAANPISLGLFTPPGEYGADIVTGEGQPLGIDLSYGGPYLGLFATKKALVRRSAGRIVGETTDAAGQRGFVLTLSTREQHIRREKASSNICTNQALATLTAAIYLATLGKLGLRKVAELCYHKAHYAAVRLSAAPGYAVNMDGVFFNEFVVHCPQPVIEINRRLRTDFNIVGGYDLSTDYPHPAPRMLVCVTEMHTREEIDRFATALETVASR